MEKSEKNTTEHEVTRTDYIDLESGYDEWKKKVNDDHKSKISKTSPTK